ncbi:MAG: hypothetical protein EOO12_10830 [Chitinophagaceae bacterium]|nr:MAG: hypothetical protein EOO12_10830 [Chitinophagaceae bacterium]
MKRIVPVAFGIAVCLTSCKKDVRTPATESETSTVLSTGKSAGNGTKTAQSVMISFGEMPTEYIYVNNQTWRFDQRAAAQGDPQWGYNSCASATSGPGNGNSCRNQAVSNAMSARCTYWSQPGHPYWTLVHETTAGTDPSAPVSFSVTIAGESYMRGGGFPNGKYSFTLGNDSASRISNLRYRVDGGAPIALAHTIVQGTPVASLGDVQYTSTGQQFGSSDVFQYLVNGTMRDVLASDGANNNDGNNVYAFTAVGVTPTVAMSLGVGTHEIVVTGTVKENEGIGTWNFTKKSTIHVSAQGCQ